MKCEKCGHENAENSKFCSQCSTGMSGDTRHHGKMGEIPSHLFLGIITTLFCCMPFGIVSIFYATQVSSRQAVGDFYGATYASMKAKFWGIFAMWFGIFFWILNSAAVGTYAIYANY